MIDPGALSRTERARLVELESAIAAGLEHIQHQAAEVGRCLREIRDQRLYRETHETWTDYLRSKEHWGHHRSRAYQLLNYADVLEDVSTTGRQPSERQARELVPLAPEQRAAVWEVATEGGADPSAAELHSLVAEVEEALAGLPPEVQRARIAEAEERALASGRQARQQQGSPRAVRIARAVKLIERLRRELEKVGPEARGLLKRLQAVSVALLALPE